LISSTASSDMDPFALLKIPAPLVNDELWEKSPEDLAFLLNFGYKIFSRTEQVYEENARVSSKQQNSLQKSFGPAAVIGQSGEQYVQTIYSQNYNVDNTAKQGRTGDLLIRRKHHVPDPVESSLLIEVKKYTSAVPSHEVEKFYRDLSANSAVQGGVFISLQTKISGIPKPFHFTRSQTSQPVVFVQSMDPAVLELAAELVWAHIDSRSMIDEQVYSKLSQKLTTLSDCINQLSMARTFVTETRAAMNKHLDRVYESIFTSEMQIQDSIASITRTIRKHLVGGEELGTDVILTTFESFGESILEEEIKRRWNDSLYATDTTHSQTVNKIATEYLEKFSTVAEWKVVYGAKGLVIKQDKSPFVGFVFLKSKTEVHLYLDTEDETVNVPHYTTFKGGAVHITVDKKYIKEGRHEQVMSYISTLYA
jgi:Restriction endonuclease